MVFMKSINQIIIYESECKVFFNYIYQLGLSAFVIIRLNVYLYRLYDMVFEDRGHVIYLCIFSWYLY